MIVAAALAVGLALAPVPTDFEVECQVVDGYMVCPDWPDGVPFPFPTRPPAPEPPTAEPDPTVEPEPEPDPAPRPVKPPAPEPAPEVVVPPVQPPTVLQPTVPPAPTPTPSPTPTKAPDVITFAPRAPVEPDRVSDAPAVEKVSAPAPKAWGWGMWLLAWSGVILLAAGTAALLRARAPRPQHARPSGRHSA